MYTVIINQSPELAIRQAAADTNTFPHTSKLPQPHPITPWPEVSEEMKRMMQRVTVTSMGYLAARDITPKNEQQARKLAAILAAGPTYESCVFFQSGAVNTVTVTE